MNQDLSRLVDGFRKFLTEETAPGIKPSDVQSLESFYEKETGEEFIEATPNNEGRLPRDDTAKRVFNEQDPAGIISKRAAGEKFSTKGDEPIVHKSNIIDKDTGKPLDLDVLKKNFSERPKNLLAQNEKMKKGGGGIRQFYNVSLPAYKGLYHDERLGELKIVTVCAMAGECKAHCFARKGSFIQYPASSLRLTKIITYLMNDWEGFKRQLLSEIQSAHAKDSKKNIETVVRWHDSGDFLSSKYLRMAYDIAKATPDVLHYAYTKRVGMVSTSEIPDNFRFTYSVGGIEDPKIEKTKMRHSEIVPLEVFKDLVARKPTGKINKKTGKPITKLAYKNFDELKKRIGKKYNVAEDTVINYDEMMEIPEGNEKKWNVVVKSGDGDDAATRKDVLGIYLLWH